MRSNHAIIAGCKISIDETIDDGEVIIKLQESYKKIDKMLLLRGDFYAERILETVII